MLLRETDWLTRLEIRCPTCQCSKLTTGSGANFGMDREMSARPRRSGDVDAAIETSRTRQSGIENIGSIGGRQEDPPEFFKPSISVSS